MQVKRSNLSDAHKTILVHSCVMIMLFLNMVSSERRIINGTQIWGEPKFMAYFIKSEQSVSYYQGWTCGGAIISTLHILTAAACIIDVDHLYAIVGYNKYVSAEEIHTDPCTKNRRKRVIRVYAPKNYKVFNSGWTNHDIGIAKLESSLDFTDTTYKIDCSYTPGAIKVNFNQKLETLGTDVIAVSWGHTAESRMPTHLQNHNEEYLREIQLFIIQKDECQRKVESLESTPAEQLVLDSNFICVQCEDKTKTSPVSEPNLNEKQPTAVEVVITSKPSPKDLYDDDAVYEELLQRYSKQKVLGKDRRRYLMRRPGLCQNDHGGPLVVWMGVEPVVIGVASTNLYNRNFSCIPPNLFTSTTPSEWFIKCSVKEDQETIRICQEIENNNGLNTNEVTSNWIGNEIAEVAPLLSLQKLLSNYVEKLNIPNVAPNAPSTYQQNGAPVPILRNQPMSVHSNEALFQSKTLPYATIPVVLDIPIYQSVNMPNAAKGNQLTVFDYEGSVPSISKQNKPYIQIQRAPIPKLQYGQNLEKQLPLYPDIPNNENANPGNTRSHQFVPNRPDTADVDTSNNVFLQAQDRYKLANNETYTQIVKIRPLKDIKSPLRNDWTLTRYNFEKRATISMRSTTIEDFRNPDVIPNMHRIKWKRRHNKEEGFNTSSVSAVSDHNISVTTSSSSGMPIYSIKRYQWYHGKLKNSTTTDRLNTTRF